jgi:hypothetical protein
VDDVDGEGSAEPVGDGDADGEPDGVGCTDSVGEGEGVPDSVADGEGDADAAGDAAGDTEAIGDGEEDVACWATVRAGLLAVAILVILSDGELLGDGFARLRGVVPALTS